MFSLTTETIGISLGTQRRGLHPDTLTLGVDWFQAARRFVRGRSRWRLVPSSTGRSVVRRWSDPRSSCCTPAGRAASRAGDLHGFPSLPRRRADYVDGRQPVDRPGEFVDKTHRDTIGRWHFPGSLGAWPSRWP